MGKLGEYAGFILLIMVLALLWTPKQLGKDAGQVVRAFQAEVGGASK